VVNTRTEIDARHHTLEVTVPDDLPAVMGDRERLVQIMTNLVSNAYKYTPAGGLIRIAVLSPAVGTGGAGDGRGQWEVPPGQLLVSVSDNGIGMSPQELEGLQEKFFRADQTLVREQPGTGLGVSITRGLVALHGGELLVESQVGKGTTFGFTLPVAA
jgi:signal transduction histidine kinase